MSGCKLTVGSVTDFSAEMRKREHRGIPMILANYHTHTARCNHAMGTEREYIETAISEGFKILGFSDHTPQPYPAWFRSGIRMDMSELYDYTETLVKLRDEYRDEIKILIGYEVEYTRQYFEPLLRELEKYPLDYIIQGQHYIEDEIDGFYAGSWTCSEERLKAYVDYTIEGMKTGRFTYLAHPDLINYMGPDDVYCRHMRRIVETAIDMDLPLEINLYGFADCRWYPSDRFFKMASEYHPRFVIGCDAHAPWFIRQPEQVEGFTDFLREYGIECGDNIIEIQEI